MVHNLSFVPAKQNSTLLYGIFADLRVSRKGAKV